MSERGYGEGFGFALIVVLFILLIIVGAFYMDRGYDYC
ncbi:YjcZ family sporulation protein [Pseudogracilibacillus sp. SE30717A]